MLIANRQDRQRFTVCLEKKKKEVEAGRPYQLMCCDVFSGLCCILGLNVPRWIIRGLGKEITYHRKYALVISSHQNRWMSRWKGIEQTVLTRHKNIFRVKITLICRAGTNTPDILSQDTYKHSKKKKCSCPERS